MFTTLAMLLGLSATAAVTPAQTNAQVDVALVLAVDMSGSMDLEEARVQRMGYVEALRHSEFINAVTAGLNGRIAISYFEWAGSVNETSLVSWQLIDDAQDAEAFAEHLASRPVFTRRGTSISNAIAFASKLIATSPYDGMRRVIDVSGDGTNNQGDLIVPTRDEIVRKGITINGLPIMLKAPVASMIDVPDLDLYYQDCVIGGPGAFLVPVRERHQFADAIRNKLLLEVAGIRPQRIPLPQDVVIPAQDKPRVSCTIGEQMWQRRWGGENYQ